jgi:formyltetrahydrofolate deformylase
MIIVIQCKDQVGLVASIAGVLAKENMNIVSMREHVDTVDNRFFVRIETEQFADAAVLEVKLSNVLSADTSIKVNPSPEKKIIVFVTREYHCLADILIRNHFKTLGATVQCVIGNHPTLENICQRFEIPFRCVTHENKSKELFEEQILNVIDQYQLY